MISVRREELSSPAAAALINALNAELAQMYPEQGATHFRLDPQEIADGAGAFLVAYRDGVAVGCGAVRRLDSQTAKLKRMYVVPSARGEGISKIVLDALHEEARKLGVERLLLETGIRQTAALNLYRRSGFREIEPFGEYLQSPATSVCMAKVLR